MGGTNDCRAYIEKIESFGTNYSPQNFVVTVSGAYSNTNYCFDDNNSFGFLQGAGGFARDAVQAVNSEASVVYSAPGTTYLTNCVNVVGYLSYGAHSALGGDYAVDGSVRFSGSSAWYIIHTIESFNGQRFGPQGTFVEWFSQAAFGGTNHSNTPVGAVTHLDEPVASNSGVNDANTFFSLWEARRRFVECAWRARRTPYFQALGDPFCVR